LRITRRRGVGPDRWLGRQVARSKETRPRGDSQRPIDAHLHGALDGSRRADKTDGTGMPSSGFFGRRGDSACHVEPAQDKGQISMYSIAVELAQLRSIILEQQRWKERMLHAVA
jgi:hypothetical protein